MEMNMHVIYKYVLDAGERFTRVELHEGYKVVCVKEQGENICVWVEQNIEQALEKTTFEVLPTGEVPEVEFGERQYRGTAHLSGGKLVFHIFEIASAWY